VKNSFALKIVSSIAIIEIAFISAIILGDLSTLKQEAESEFRKRVSVITEMFANAATNSLIATDIANLKHLAEKLVADKDISNVIVKDNEGNSLIDMGDENLDEIRKYIGNSTQVLNGRTHFVQKTILVSDYLVGEIYLGFSVEYITSTLNAATKKTIGVASIGLFLFSIFLYLLSSYISRSFSDIKIAAKEIAVGNMNFRLPVTTTDELGQAAYALNTMAEKLKEDKKLKDSVIDSAFSALVILNEKVEIVKHNAVFSAMFNTYDGAVIGKKLSLFCDIENTSLFDYDYIFKKFSKSAVTTVRPKGGETIPVEIKAVAIVINGKNHLLTYIRNLSDQKKSEKAKDEFISVVSHELRTPLTAIQGGVRLLLGGVAGELNKKSRELLNLVDANSRRLILLVNDILDIQQYEVGGVRYNFSLFDIGTIIEEAVKLNHAYADEYDVMLESIVDMDRDLYLNIDYDRIMQVLSNLISNAVKFSKKNSVVSISAFRQGDLAVFSVADKGSGIAQDNHSKVFQKFFQSDSSSTRKTKGTGLGLVISKNIVDAHGGKIWFESVENMGSVFYFSIEIAKNIARRTA